MKENSMSTTFNHYNEKNISKGLNVNPKILVVSPHYRTVVKGCLESISKHLYKIDVIIPHNRFVEIVKYIPFSYFRNVGHKYTKEKLTDIINKPTTINIYLVNVIYFLPLKYNKRLGDMLFKTLDSFIQKNHLTFDLIHAQFTWPFGYVGVKLGKKYNVPSLITAHGYDVYDLPFRGVFWFEKIKWALESADYIITVSNRNLKIIKEKIGISDNKISVIPNGFNDSLFKPISKEHSRKTLNLPINKKIILSAGNLVPIKGHIYLIKAMAKVIKEEKNIFLIIAGDGKLKPKLERQIKDLRLSRIVRFVGRIPHTEIPLWMNAADLFVLPSLSEGNPTVMFEALGIGLPFVGTAVGGVPEIITSEDYGFLCPPKDPECLAEKILIALERDWDKKKIREYAEQFTWEKISTETINVYIDLLSNKNLKNKH